MNNLYFHKIEFISVIFSTIDFMSLRAQQPQSKNTKFDEFANPTFKSNFLPLELFSMAFKRYCHIPSPNDKIIRINLAKSKALIVNLKCKTNLCDICFKCQILNGFIKILQWLGFFHVFKNHTYSLLDKLVYLSLDYPERVYNKLSWINLVLSFPCLTVTDCLFWHF